MRCPKCGGGNDKVVDSRSANDDYVVKRRRECTDCGHRFTTLESVVPEEIHVIKRSGELEEFDRAKIRRGVANACYKRPVTNEQITGVVDEITRELIKRCEPEVQSSQIGELVMEKLKGLDEVAYVRFASVYRKFEAAEDFISEVTELKK